MILADKIIKLRKKNGWSQEELAEKMEVSRQAVSKWEGAQTVPDLEKILRLSNLFGVTTDYLLKDEIETEEFSETDSDSCLRKVTMEDANSYLRHRKWAAKIISLATVLCIWSPVALVVLGLLDYHGIVNTDTFGPIIGLVSLFLMVAVAVSLYIYCGFKNSPYEFLDKENYESEYGVRGMVKEKQKAFRSTYIKMNIVATVLCVLSPLPLIIGALSGNAVAFYCTLVALIFMVSIAVTMFIYSGVRYASIQRLLKEGEFDNKRKYRIRESIETCYWLLATAIYLAWSFISGDWSVTWIVWPVAGVLSAVVTLTLNLVLDKEN